MFSLEKVLFELGEIIGMQINELDFFLVYSFKVVLLLLAWVLMALMALQDGQKADSGAEKTSCC